MRSVMASEGGGKFKQKRNQSQSKPYARTPSLLGKLKESVKDLLIPSWLTGSSLKQEEADSGSVAQLQTVETTLSGRAGHSGHEWSQGIAFQSDILVSGPMDGHYGNSASGKTPTQASNIPGYGLQTPNGGLQTGQSPFCITPAPNMTIGSHMQPMSSLSNKVGLSLRGATGLSFETPEKESDLERDDQRYNRSLEIQNSQEFVETPARPITISTRLDKSTSIRPAVKRPRLGSLEPIRMGKPLLPPVRDKPTFNSLLFGTSISKDESSMARSFGESSFYVGKTCYGGASASKKKLLNTSSPYLSSLPLRKQVKATKLNSSLNATTSSTAQRILDTLERMSTPLEDAKKIPQADQSNDSVLSFTPSSYRRQSSQCSVRPITRPLQLPNRGPPTSQLQSTSQIEIVKNRDRSKSIGLSDSCLSITQENVSTKESVVNNSSVPAASFGLKMKSKKYSMHVKGQQEEETIHTPDLRTDFTLPVSSIAPISLLSGNDKSNSVVIGTAVSSKSGGVSSLEFTFSTPIEERNCLRGSQTCGLEDQGFKFSSPIHVSANKMSAAGAEEGSKSSPAVGAANPQVSMWSPQMTKAKAISPDIGGTSSFKSCNKWSGIHKDEASDASPAFGVMPGVATTLKKGSAMDILGSGKNTTTTTNNVNCNSGQSSNVPLSQLFKKPAGSWSCDTCMVENTVNDVKCVACTTPRPRSKPPVPVAGSKQDKPLSELFKKPVGSWDCDICMVQNDASRNKCIACSASKPGSKSTAPISVPKSNVSLSELFKKPEGTWECDTCMIQNTPVATKCVACEMPKPGAKSAAPVNKTHNSLGVMFKKPEGSWDCDTCLVQNTSSALRCIACDASKPGLKFAGIVSKPATTSSSSNFKMAPGGGFSFNLPSTSTTATTTGSAGFKFGNTSASVIPSDAATSNSGGFSFALNNSQDNKVSVNSSESKTLPPGGGFHFGPLSNTSAREPSGGVKFGTSVIPNDKTTIKVASSSDASVSKPSGGFQFGASTASSTVPTCNVGFSFSASQKVDLSNCQSVLNAPLLSSSVSFTSSDNASKSITAETGGFQFGSSSSSHSTVPVDKKSEVSVAPHPSLTFGAASANLTESPFVFGATVSTAQTNAERGADHSLATSVPAATPLVNGGFGACLGSTNSGFNTNSSALVFGAKPASNVISSSQNLSTIKRSVDGAAAGQASTPFVFGANPSSQTASDGAAGGFQFSAAAPAAQPNPAAGFSFNTKVQSGFDSRASKKNEVSFNAKQDFNFSATSGDGNNLFQFGSKAAEAPSSNLFTFGASSTPLMTQSTVPVFGGAAAGPAGGGGFNIGSADTSQRKVRKAVRRIRQPR